MRADIVPCQKADTAYNNQQHDDDVDQWIGNVRRQRGIQCAGAAENIEPRIAEGGYGVKHRHPHAPQPIVPAERRPQRQRTHQLYKECSL